MSFAWFVTLIAGLLAVAGAAGLFVGLLLEGERRRFCLRAASYGLTGSGLVLAGGSLFDLIKPDVFLPGMMMIFFGTGLEFMPRARGPRSPAAGSDGCGRPTA